MRHLIRFSNQLLISTVLLVFVLAAVPPATAQSEVTQLSTLAVEMWPDYDRPSMLVLLTGALPAETALPATLTIPLPPEAEIHAAASFNEAGALMADVDYTVENGRMTLTTPSSRFRVEYYDPYEADGTDYSYVFEWLSDLSIDQASVVVQQPIAATDFRITPAATSSNAERGDGLTYHTLPSRSVSAGEPFTVEVAYTVAAPVLSAPSQSPIDESAATAPASGTTGSGSSGFDPVWLLVGAGVLALAGGAWYLGQRQGRTASRAQKPHPTRPAKPKPSSGKSTSANSTQSAAGPARFCHNCGQRAQSGDTFCRSCGTQLKSE